MQEYGAHGAFWNTQAASIALFSDNDNIFLSYDSIRWANLGAWGVSALQTYYWFINQRPFSNNPHSGLAGVHQSLFVITTRYFTISAARTLQRISID
jgi:hypothetical protein